MSAIDPPQAEYCSQQHQNSSMLGTAEQVELWLLLEAPGSWPERAIEAGPLPLELRGWLTESLAKLEVLGVKARPQLIKQRGSGATPGRRLLLGFAGALYAWSGLSDQDLRSLDLAALVAALRDRQPISAQRLLEPHFFVCSNGRRDVCCARYGLPVYRQLQERIGERAWQISHVGGHRFAANVLTLPDGVMYGRLQPEQCATFERTVAAGELDFAHLRGRSAYPPAVQAAEGLVALPGLQLRGVSEDDAGTTVQFLGAQRQHAITVRRATEPLLVLAGCNKPAPKVFYPFERAFER